MTMVDGIATNTMVLMAGVLLGLLLVDWVWVLL
jgi:hypothetical protein